MAQDLLNLQPSVINTSLSGKTILLAGQPKIGKSEWCATSPRTLIFDFENGYNAHPGVYKVSVSKWSDVKMYLQQLKRDELKEKYSNVAFDTISVAWDLCTQYICAQSGVSKIGEIPYGAGYKARDDEFANTLRSFIMLDYGLILTCHIKETVVGTQDNVDVISLKPDLDKRCLPIVNSLVDVIGVIQQTWDDQGNSQRWLLTKATPTITAGSRWAHLDAKIPFGYQSLEAAIARAIEAEANAGASVVSEKPTAEKNRPFKETVEEGRALWNQLVALDPNNSEKIMKIVSDIFGKTIRLSEITEEQQDLFELVILGMKNLLK